MNSSLHKRLLGIPITYGLAIAFLLASGSCMKNNDAPGNTGLQYRANDNLVSVLSRNSNDLVTSNVNKVDSTVSISTKDLPCADGKMYKLNLNIKHYAGVGSYNSPHSLQAQMTVTDDAKHNYVLDSPYISNVKIQSEDGKYINGIFTIRMKNTDSNATVNNTYLNLEGGTFFLKYQQ